MIPPNGGSRDTTGGRDRGGPSGPALSVLVPVYNHEHYLAEAIGSIWDQGVTDLEIVAIDDGSRDGSLRVLEALRDRSPVPMRIASRPNRGLTRTLNEALAMARGEYVLVLASDDRLLPGGLRPALDGVREGGGVQFAIYNAQYFGDVEGVVYLAETGALLASDPPRILRRLYVEPPKPILLQSTILSRSFLAELGGWDEQVVLDDWPMFIRLFERVVHAGARYRYDGAIGLSGYRIHGSNAHKDLERQVRMCEEVVRTLCPPELRGEALANTYVDYGLSALRRRDGRGLDLMRRAARAGGWWFTGRTVCGRILRYYTRRRA